MMLRGGQVKAGSAANPFSMRIRLSLALLRDEVAVGSPELARVGLIAIAIALQTIVLESPGHFRPAPNALFAVLAPTLTLLSLLLCLVATLPLKRMLSSSGRRLLAGAALAICGVLATMGISNTIIGVSAVVASHPYTNDGAAMDLYAAQQVARGHNPYLQTNIVLALAGIDAPAMTTTPLMDGQFRGVRAYPSDEAISQVFLNVLRYRPRTIPPEFESKYNYPAGSFLFILPFVWAGMHDMRFLYALALLAMGGYLWFRIPRTLRPLVPFIVLADVPLMMLTSGGQPDPLYGLFLMIGYAEWRKRWLSPLSMGLAVATKQLAWFFVPFYLVLIATQSGWREALRRGGIMLAVFSVINGPFIVQSPGAYVTSLAGPMSDPMFPMGVGIVALFVANIVPLIPKFAFTLAELAAWGGALVTASRVRILAPAAGAVFAALPLFFAYRSLVNYFYLVPLLTLAIMLGNPFQQAVRPSNA